MLDAVPISITKFDTFGLLYFNVESIFQYEMVESAHLVLEVNGNASIEEISCYLNERNDYRIQKSYYTKKFEDYRGSSKKELILDISENYHKLVSRTNENNGMILNFGRNKLFSCQLYLTYRKEIIAPRYWCMPFFEKELFISTMKSEVYSPFFMIASASMITFCVENLGEQEIFVAAESSPDAKKSIKCLTMLEVLPSGMVLLTPKYFTKYTRLFISSSENGILTKVWFQCQQIR